MELKKELLEYLFEIWGKKQEKWDGYAIQEEYFKSIKENVSKIKNYLEIAERFPEKKEKIKRCYPTNYFFWKCYKLNLLNTNGVTPLEILIELNKPASDKILYDNDNRDRNYFQNSKTILKSNNIDVDEFEMEKLYQDYITEFKVGEKKIDWFLETNKEYYSKIIDDPNDKFPIASIIDCVVSVFKNTNSNKAAQGANKKVINQGNNLFDVLSIFNLFTNFDNFKKIDASKIAHLKNVLKEAFSISTLTDENSFIYNQRVNDVFAVLFRDYKNKNNTIEYVLPYYNYIKDLYKKKLEKNVKNVVIKNSEVFGENLNNMNVNMQIDQMIYYYSRYILNTYDFFDFKKNIIFYGSPGTGKTRMAKTSCFDYFSKWKSEYDIMNSKYDDHNDFAQFHPSYNYEGFIEGIRPKGLDNDKKLELSLEDGVFKKFCREAAKYEKEYYEKFYQKYEYYPGITNEKEAFNKITKDNLSSLNLDLDEGLLKKILNDVNIEEDEKIIDYVPPYFFIVDEINRADLSKVLGELMYCLEYRGFDSKAKFKTLYSNLSKEKNPFFKVKGDDYFFIPHNLYFIGTMNTIDRSVESFDFALRRRFFWKEVEPKEEVIKIELSINGFGKEDISYIINIFNTINKQIKKEFSDQYQIGHSYFLELIKFKMINEKDKDDYDFKEVLDMLWNYSIKPILEEYYRGFAKIDESIEEYKKIWKSKNLSKN